MLGPSELIAALDATLDVGGSDLTLRRIVGTLPNVAYIDAKVRGSVRSSGTRELASGIAQAVSQIVLSPSGIAAAQWPGGSDPNAPVDPALPHRGDRVIIEGRIRDVEAVNPIYIDGTLVRIDLEVLG